jgi:hypothetical protein
VVVVCLPAAMASSIVVSRSCRDVLPGRFRRSRPSAVATSGARSHLKL